MDFAMNDLAGLRNLLELEFIEASWPCQIQHDRRQVRERKPTVKQIGLTFSQWLLRGRTRSLRNILDFRFWIEEPKT